MRPYLLHPSFAEQHKGPHVETTAGTELAIRDPSPAQIEAMCEAIRATWSEARWFQELVGRTVAFDLWCKRNGISQATHIPHGISATEIGAQRCLNIFI